MNNGIHTLYRLIPVRIPQVITDLNDFHTSEGGRGGSRSYTDLISGINQFRNQVSSNKTCAARYKYLGAHGITPLVLRSVGLDFTKFGSARYATSIAPANANNEIPTNGERL